jgi:hypothetical protein
MANKIFDRETLLDLTVNVVPLFIIAFFVVAFAVFPAFGFDPLASALQYGLLAVPFVLLAILTYLSGKAIAGDEKRSTVYPPGAATVEGVEPLHEEEAETASDAGAETEAEPATGDDAETQAETRAEDDAETETTPDSESETETTPESAND